MKSPGGPACHSTGVTDWKCSLLQTVRISELVTVGMIYYSTKYIVYINTYHLFPAYIFKGNITHSQNIVGGIWKK